MNRMKTTGFLAIICLLCGLFVNVTMAQSGQRFAEPVFDEVNVVKGVPYSSAVREGQSDSTTLYFDFYEPQDDTMTERPLVITIFGGAFVSGGRDFSDMVGYCTRLAKHGYAAAAIDYRLLSVMNLSHKGLVRDAYMAAQDVSSAVRFFKCHYDTYKIDTSRAFLLGNSAGSIALLCELFMGEDERPVETLGSLDLGSMHSSGFSEYAGYSPKVAGAIPHWGGVINCDIISEEEYVPLCMIHGTADATVPVDSGFCFSSSLFGLMPFVYGSQAIANHLDEMGISDYAFYPFEGEDHAFYYNTFFQLNDQFDTCFKITCDFLLGHLNYLNAMPEREEALLRVYPNPATDRVIVAVCEGAMEGSCTYAVMDDMGRKMIEEESFASPFTIDVSQWPSGVYFVRISCNRINCSRKFVKQ